MLLVKQFEKFEEESDFYGRSILKSQNQLKKKDFFAHISITILLVLFDFIEKFILYYVEFNYKDITLNRNS